MANTATTKQQLDALTYDTEVYTAAGVDAAIASAVSSAYKAKGTKTISQLNTLAPSVANADSSLKVGDVYNLSDGGTLAAPATNGEATVVAGDNVVWTADGWDRLRGIVDLSGYALSTDVTVTGIKLEGASSNLTPSSKVVTIPNAVPTGTGETNGLMTAADKAKLNGVAAGAQANVIESIKLAGASSSLSVSSKTVTIPDAVATGQTGETNGLMTAADKKQIGDDHSKRLAVATALSTYNALTASSSMESTRTLINALLSALQTFGAAS